MSWRAHYGLMIVSMFSQDEDMRDTWCLNRLQADELDLPPVLLQRLL